MMTVLSSSPVFTACAALLGLCIGSFLNVVIHRLPKMMERQWRAECAELAGQEPPPAERYNLGGPNNFTFTAPLTTNKQTILYG